MEFEATVIALLPVVKGTSARGEWTKQEVIFEQAGEFGRKICVGFWGDKAQDAGGLQPGERVSVAANVESREYNGRWYTEVRAWRMSRVGSGAGAGADAGSGAGTGYGSGYGGGYGAGVSGTSGAGGTAPSA